MTSHGPTFAVGLVVMMKIAFRVQTQNQHEIRVGRRVPIRVQACTAL
jgi:hypothetical protein